MNINEAQSIINEIKNKAANNLEFKSQLIAQPKTTIERHLGKEIKLLKNVKFAIED